MSKITLGKKNKVFQRYPLVKLPLIQDRQLLDLGFAYSMKPQVDLRIRDLSVSVAVTAQC